MQKEVHEIQALKYHLEILERWWAVVDFRGECNGRLQFVLIMERDLSSLTKREVVPGLCHHDSQDVLHQTLKNDVHGVRDV